MIASFINSQELIDNRNISSCDRCQYFNLLKNLLWYRWNIYYVFRGQAIFSRTKNNIFILTSWLCFNNEIKLPTYCNYRINFNIHEIVFIWIWKLFIFDYLYLSKFSIFLKIGSSSKFEFFGSELSSSSKIWSLYINLSVREASSILSWTFLTVILSVFYDFLKRIYIQI